MQLLRVSGCAGILPAAGPLQHNRQLDRAAALWAAGDVPLAAAGRSGYPAQLAVGLRLSGPDDAILQSLRRSRCRPLADQSLRDIGVYRRGFQTWVVLGAPAASRTLPPPTPPPVSRPQPAGTSSPEETDDAAPRTYAYATAPGPSRASAQATRVLQLVNEVRARGTRCGDRSFAPAPPLRLSATLESVAGEHAKDMARHDYFEHVDLGGHTPADRVRASGYRETLVGENIAYGPTSADEVVAGWLHSSGHCENIMEPRFVEMGLALAPGQGSKRGLYWDQVLTQPAK
ncbi:MAG TPA: CAP domain-containing protein [Steroidobacteraceae bacterium]|nr:CAP domain-containing protein [Steroidobacteraceae bacterium]